MHDEKNNRPLEYARPEGEWMRPDMRVAVFFAGGLFMVLALCATHVTLVSHDYRQVHLHGFLAAVAAVVCFLVGCHRGGWGWKLGAAVASAPSVWVAFVLVEYWL